MISTTTERPPIDGLPNLPPSSGELRSRALYCLSGAIKHNEEAVLSLDNNGGWGWEVLKGALSGMCKIPETPPHSTGHHTHHTRLLFYTDPSLVIRRKAAFLLSTILLLVPLAGTATGFAPYSPHTASTPSPSKRILASFASHHLPSTVLASLSSSSSHPAPGPNADESPASEDPDYKEKASKVLVLLAERKALLDGQKEEFATLVKGWESSEGGLEAAIGLGQTEQASLKRSLSI